MNFHEFGDLSSDVEEDLQDFQVRLSAQDPTPSSAPPKISSPSDVWPRDDDALLLITESFNNHVMGTTFPVANAPQDRNQDNVFAPDDFFQDAPLPRHSMLARQQLSRENGGRLNRNMRPINTSLSPFSDHVSIDSPINNLLLDSSPTTTTPLLDIMASRSLVYESESPILAYPNEHSAPELLFLRHYPSKALSQDHQDQQDHQYQQYQQQHLSHQPSQQHQHPYQLPPQPAHQPQSQLKENLRFMAHHNLSRSLGQNDLQSPPLPSAPPPLNVSYVESLNTSMQPACPIQNEELLHVRLPLMYSSHSDMSSQFGEPPFQDAASHFSQLPGVDSGIWNMPNGSPSFHLYQDDGFALPDDQTQPPLYPLPDNPADFPPDFPLDSPSDFPLDFPSNMPRDPPVKIIVPPTFKFDANEDDDLLSPIEHKMRQSVTENDLDNYKFKNMSPDTYQNPNAMGKHSLDGPIYTVIASEATRMAFPSQSLPLSSNGAKTKSESSNQDQEFLDPNDYHPIKRGRRASQSIRSRLRSNSHLAHLGSYLLGKAGVLKPQHAPKSRLRLRLILRLRPPLRLPLPLPLPQNIPLHISLQPHFLSPSPTSSSSPSLHRTPSSSHSRSPSYHGDVNTDGNEDDDSHYDDDDDKYLEEGHLGDGTDSERRKMLYLAAPARLAKSTQKNPSIYECHLCSKRFTRPYNLKSHLRTHTDDRPFICTICNKAFARQHDRKRHEDLHLGAKKYQCRGFLKDGTQYGCERKFARADALRRHFQTENGKECVKVLREEARRDGIAGFDQIPDPEEYATTFEAPDLDIMTSF